MCAHPQIPGLGPLRGVWPSLLPLAPTAGDGAGVGGAGGREAEWIRAGLRTKQRQGCGCHQLAEYPACGSHWVGISSLSSSCLPLSPQEVEPGWLHVAMQARHCEPQAYHSCGQQWNPLEFQNKATLPCTLLVC